MQDNFLDEFNQIGKAQATAEKFGARPELVQSIIQQESGGQQSAVSPKGALGVMQVMPATAANPGFGVTPFDPKDPTQNAAGGKAYFEALLKHYNGDEQLALAAYNAGPGRVDKAGGVPNIPETQKYVKQVMDRAGNKDDLSWFNSIGQEQDAPSTTAAGQPGFLENVVESGKNFVSGMANAVVHPLDTAAGLGKIAAGTAQLVLPEGATGLDDYTAYPKAVAEFYKNRYGSLDKAGHTLYTDPVGALADVASVAGGVGGALKLGGLARAGSIAGKVAEFTDPISIAGKVASRTIQPVLRNTAEHLVNVNMQVPKAIRRADKNMGISRAADVLETGRGTNPFTRLSHGGEANAIQMVEDQGVKFADLLGKYDAGGGRKLSLQAVEDALNEAMAEAQRQGNAQPRVAQIRQVLENLKNNPLYHTADQHVPASVTQVPTGAVNAQGLPITQSQQVPGYMIPGKWIDQTASGLNELKVNTDANLSKAYGVDVAATTAAEKTLARTADKVLDTNVPGADAQNQIRARTIRARNALSEAILSKQTKRGMGLAEGLLAGGAALGAAGHPGAAAMTIPWVYNTVVKHPSLTSPVAAALYAPGTFKMGPKLQGLEKASLVGSRANAATADVAKRPVTRAEVNEKVAGFEAFKAAGAAAPTATPAAAPDVDVVDQTNNVDEEPKYRIKTMPPDEPPARKRDYSALIEAGKPHRFK